MEVDRMNCLERAGKKILSHIVIIEQIGWPPSCWGPGGRALDRRQPARPRQRYEQKEDAYEKTRETVVKLVPDLCHGTGYDTCLYPAGPGGHQPGRRL